MQSAILFILMYAGEAARIAVLARAIYSRIWRPHVFFCAMVVLSLARTIPVLTGRQHPYTEIWTATQWPMAALGAAAALEAFWRLALHFRNIRNFGWILFGIILVVSAGAAVAVGTLRARWNSPLNGPILVGQYTQMALLLTTLLSLGFFRQLPDVPVRPNAIRHLLALATQFGFYFTGDFLGQISRGQMRLMANLVLATGAVVSFTYWAVAMTREGENLPFAQAPPISKEEFDASERAHRRNEQELRRKSEEALRNKFRA